MHSIRAKITLMTVCAIIISVSIAACIGVISVKNLGSSDSNQMLQLLCKTGEKNLDSYFESVEQSVRTISMLVQEDLDGLQDDQLAGHMERARALFAKVVYHTNGVLTYYYRLDPGVSQTEKGFWYTNLDGEGFVEHEVTDITLYDTEDTSRLVWFTVPRSTGQDIWLPPYITDNLDVRVISYNVPVQWNGQFLGVIGIEIDYSTMATEIDNMRLFENGYAFITDMEGNIIYHPTIDVTTMRDEDRPAVPDGLISENEHIRYRFGGVDKVGVWLPLSNGMRLTVSVPISEINSEWHELIREIVVASIFVLIIVSIFTMHFSGRLTQPLRDLTAAAEQVDKGIYEFSLDYDGEDEVGILTGTFKRLVDHLKIHISDLNKRVFVDVLTSVRNKGAFAAYLQELQDQMDSTQGHMELAIGVFDCDDLMIINDQHGHDKGDIYLKAASNLICHVFQHSTVFRIGGDEFAVVMQHEDYQNREELFERFRNTRQQICESAENPWEQVHITMGIAVYDPAVDPSALDVVRRADKVMYENKRMRKKARASAEGRQSPLEDAGRA